MAQVLSQPVGETQAQRIAASVFRISDAAERAQGRLPRLGRALSRGDALGRFLFEVKLQLRVDLLLDAFAPDQRTQPRLQRPDRAHRAS